MVILNIPIFFNCFLCYCRIILKFIWKSAERQTNKDENTDNLICSCFFMRHTFQYSWWRHQMEIFSALLAICAGNSRVNSPHKGLWRGALTFSLISAWMNGWVNDGDAGDLRRHHAHYDVTVMILVASFQFDGPDTDSPMVLFLSKGFWQCINHML